MPAPLTSSELISQASNSALTDTESPSWNASASPSAFGSVRTNGGASTSHSQRGVSAHGGWAGGRSRSRSARPSFATQRTRRGSRATMIIHDDADPNHGGTGDGEGVKLPTLVPGIRPAYSTPLPTLPMVVLCIVSGQIDGGSERLERCCQDFHLLRVENADSPGYVVGAIVSKSLHTVHPQNGRR